MFCYNRYNTEKCLLFIYISRDDNLEIPSFPSLACVSASCCLCYCIGLTATNCSSTNQTLYEAWQYLVSSINQCDLLRLAFSWKSLSIYCVDCIIKPLIVAVAWLKADLISMGIFPLCCSSTTKWGVIQTLVCEDGGAGAEFIFLFMGAFGLTAVLASAALVITESVKRHP